MLKRIGTILNIAFIGFVIYLIIENFDYFDIEDYLISTAFILFSLINIVLIATNKNEDFISLYFRRKTLEEKKKIQELENK